MRFLRLVADRGRIVSTLALAMAFVVAIAGVAAAQEGPTRPFKGLFGGNERKQDGKQTLDVTASLQGGRDSDVLGLDASQAMDPRYQLGGEFASTNVGISYSAATAERGIAVS